MTDSRTHQRRGDDRGPGVRLLLVDDHDDTLDLLTIILGAKYDVRGCTSAAEALEILNGAQPDVLVLDIRMSPVDGLQCLEAIRAIPRYAHTPAIALTAFAREEDRQTFLAGGFQAVVTKPVVDLDNLVALIDSLVDARPARRSAVRATGVPLIPPSSLAAS